MSAAKRYLLDANIFIQAHQTYYGLDTCPGFWDALIREHLAKRVFSIGKVKAELLAIEDALSDWVKEKAPATLFKGTADKQVTDLFREFLNWVHLQSQFIPTAKSKFANAADGWIIAYAKVNGLVVVTHEELAPGARKTVPMPNVCIQFDVEYCDTFAMLCDLKAQFVLRHRKPPK